MCTVCICTAEPRLSGVNADQTIAGYLKQLDMQCSIIALNLSIDDHVIIM